MYVRPKDPITSGIACMVASLAFFFKAPNYFLGIFDNILNGLFSEI